MTLFTVCSDWLAGRRARAFAYYVRLFLFVKQFVQLSHNVNKILIYSWVPRMPGTSPVIGKSGWGYYDRVLVKRYSGSTYGLVTCITTTLRRPDTELGASRTVCHPVSLRQKHWASSGAGWRHISLLLHSTNYKLYRTALRQFLFCTVNRKVFLKFFFYLTTLY